MTIYNIQIFLIKINAMFGNPFKKIVSSASFIIHIFQIFSAGQGGDSESDRVLQL